MVSGDPASKSTPINWQDGMDLTKRVQEQMIPSDRKRKLRPNRTFFSWFLDNKDPSADDIAEVSLSFSCVCVFVYIHIWHSEVEMALFSLEAKKNKC